ncbi:MAG: hypothetical protein FWC16_07155, partial [Defluviitaleaceae bacterium]|nr:hypothetical protein [Defluviitaleaceae bacterium]MCL2274690.1 hypothetical protein [Defluviitaleaceae bacterium]
KSRKYRHARKYKRRLLGFDKSKTWLSYARRRGKPRGNQSVQRANTVVARRGVAIACRQSCDALFRHVPVGSRVVYITLFDIS